MTNIDKFKDTSLLIVGDVMVDRYCWGTVSRISPEAPVPVVRLDRETIRPGGAANVAANAASLGAEVTLIGIVGNDSAASNLRSAIKELGIADSDLVSSESRQTIVKTRILAHGQQIVRLDTEDHSLVEEAECQKIISVVRERIENANLVILSDYGKGLLNDRVALEIIEMCRESNKPVLADPKGKRFEKYAGATVLTPNRREAAEACKIEESDPELVQKSGRALLAEYGVANVLITESENGMTLFRRDGSPVHFSTAAREVFDVTGAGDTVIACLGVAIASGFSPVEAARLSNIAAGLSVQHIGTVAVSFDELAAELNNLEASSRRSDSNDDV
ncbi:MAG: D-glycero-beta-D-manno-heptose-7-phosphate kinase [Pyrinomonadaceae bacterium]